MIANAGFLMMRLGLMIAALSGPPLSLALAHSGGLNAEGCHNNRKTGDYHCHRGPVAPTRRQSLMGSGSTFPSCTAARSAGAAPVRIGDRGYGRHLDRDGDGIGCE
ncbi:excalibur calcium-binding domain-containing protein [Sphingobium sp. TomTYG45]